MKKQLLLLCLIALSSIAYAQNRVSGTITDAETNEPLLGAAVVIDGTTVGTTADFDGNFELSSNVNFPWTLTISFTGFTKVTQTITESTSRLSIALQPNAQQLDEVVVGVTRRTENIQEVPVSVSTLSSKQLKSLDVQDLNDVTLFIPGVEYTDNPIVNNIFVRGLGSGVTQNIEQSAGRFVDDIYISRSIVNTHMTFDLGNVEVLRGPQGTLFGKNTLAGAFIQRTQAPTSSFQAGVSTKFGFYSTRGGNQEIESFISGGLSDNLRARFAFKIRNNSGWMINTAPDGDNGQERFDYGLRLRLDWDWSEKTTARFKIEQNHWSANGSNIELTGFTADAGGDALRAGYESYVSNFEATRNWEQYLPRTPFSEFMPPENYPQNNQDYQLISLDIEHRFDNGATFNSITGYQHYDLENIFTPIDAGILPAFQATRFEQFDAFQQEFRYASATGDDKNFDYIAGVYFDYNSLSRQQIDYVDFVTLPFVFGAAPLQIQRSNPFDQKLWSLSAYAQARWKMSDKFRLIFGTRVGTEEKDFEVTRSYTTLDGSTELIFEPPNGVANALGATMFRPSTTIDFSNFTPQATLQYIPSEGNMIYLSYSEGFKGGGFSDRVTNDEVDGSGNLVDPGTYEPEEATAFELGFKNTFFDGALTTNLIFYTMNIDNLQVAGTIPGTVLFNVYNAAEVTSQGLEFDFNSNLGNGWTLGGNYAYLDATYDSFPVTSAYANQPADEVFYADDDVDQANPLQSLTGKTLSFSPQHKATIYLGKETTFNNDWSMNFLASGTFSSGYFTEYALDPNNYQDDYSIFQANLSFTTPNDQWTFGVIGKNLTNEAVAGYALDTPAFPSYYSILNAPRELAVRVDYRF